MRIKYTAKEYKPEDHKGVGNHSFYAVPLLNGTLTSAELIQEACSKTSIEESIMTAAVKEYIKAVQNNVLKGFRCNIGDGFIQVYPGLSVSVNDDLAAKMTQGKQTVATADLVKANNANAKSRLAATVLTKFSQKFAAEVQWQKVKADGTAVEEEEDITQGNTPGDGGGLDA